MSTAPGDPAQALRQHLLEQIKTRAWRAGQRLPPERELGQGFGLGRSGVRRVLAEFKRRRLVVQTVGSGTYVAERVHEALAELALAELPPAAPAQSVSPAELMEARLVLEPALIDAVVARATAADLDRMDACNRHAEAATTFEDFERWDAALHEAIADAAHNGFIAAVFRLMNQVRQQAEWGALKRRSATPERRLDYQRQHRELVAALRERDAARAQAACVAHLVSVRTNLLGR